MLRKWEKLLLIKCSKVIPSLEIVAINPPFIPIEIEQKKKKIKCDDNGEYVVRAPYEKNIEITGKKTNCYLYFSRYHYHLMSPSSDELFSFLLSCICLYWK